MITNKIQRMIAARICLIAAALLPLAGCEIFNRSTTPDSPALPDRYLSEGQRAALAKVANLPGDAIPVDGEQPAITWPASVLVEDFEILAFGPLNQDDERIDDARLQKWLNPVKISLHFGKSLSSDKRAVDRAHILSLTSRLEHFTGHPIRLAEKDPNIHVFVMNEARIVTIGQAAKGVKGELGASSCVLDIAAQQKPESGLKEASIYIRADLTEEARHHCYRRLISQSLGFTKGEGQMPSILAADPLTTGFTSHDDLMLRILYDPRLQPGITRSEARPIVRVLARELGAS